MLWAVIQKREYLDYLADISGGGGQHSQFYRRDDLGAVFARSEDALCCGPRLRNCRRGDKEGADAVQTDIPRLQLQIIKVLNQESKESLPLCEEEG